MAVNIDWSLAGPGAGSIVQNALAGYQQGQQIGRERRTRNALAAYAQDPSRVSDVIAADPETGIALRRQDQQQALVTQQQARETEARHQQGTAQIFQAALGLPVEQRQAFIADSIRQRGDIWSPQDAERAIAAVTSPQANFTDENLIAGIRGRGQNPYEGAVTVHRGDELVIPGRQGAIAHGARPNPNVVSLGNGQWIVSNQDELNAWDRQYGGGATPPALPGPQGEAPQIASPAAVGAGSGVGAAPGAPAAGPAPAPGSVAAVFATPADRRAAAIFLQGESGHGDGEDHAALSALANQAAAAGMGAEQFLRTHPSYSYAYSRGNGATRNFNPDGPQGQRYGQLIDQLASGQIELLPYTNFEGTAFPVRDFERNPVTIGRTRFTTLPLAGGSRGRPQPAAAPAQQTAPTGSNAPAGGIPVYGTDRNAPIEARRAAHERHQETNDDARLALERDRLALERDRLAATNRQGRPLTAAERQQFPGAAFMNPNGTPGYAPARASRASNMPDTAARREEHDTQTVSAATDYSQRLSTHLGRIQSGELVFSPTANARANPAVQGVLGSTPNTRNMQDFRADVEGLRNAILQMNVGPQTDSDARRAADEILNNMSDSRIVAQGIRRLLGVQSRAQRAALATINRRRARFGDDPMTLEELTGDLPSVYQSGPFDNVGASAAMGAAPTTRPLQPMPDRQGNFPRPQAQRPAAATPRGSRPAPPRVGEVRAGYRFNGGDPANPRSWSRAR